MEHKTDSKVQQRVAVFARLDLTRLPPTNGYAHIDENSTSKLHIHAYNYSDELTKIAEETLTLYPASSVGSHRIHYLISVTGQRVCVTYLNTDKKHIFELYEVDLDKHRFNLLNSFVIDVELGPSAIMAIKDRCFLGFSTSTGVVDLTAAKMRVDIFHKFDAVRGKAIDAFGYNGGKTLFAVDDIKSPKYAFYYDISGAPKKKGKKINLPAGINEKYEDCVKVHGEIAVRSHYSHRGGSGNKLYILGALGTVLHSCTLQCRSGDMTGIHPRFTSMGYLQDGVWLLVSNYEHEKDPDGCVRYLHKREMTGTVSKVRKLEIGDRCQDVVTVKDKEIGHVLATKKGNSILTQVKWRGEQLEVVKELVVSDQPFDRVFLEM